MNCYLISKQKFLVRILVLLSLAFWQCGALDEENSQQNNTPSVTNPIAKPKPFNINFMVENSLSMEGYFKVGSAFTDNAFNLLTDLEAAPYCKALNIGTVNSEGYKCLYPNAVIDGTRDDAYTFKQKYLNANGIKRTNYKAFIRDVVASVNTNNVTVFVSDCIYSDPTTSSSTLATGIKGIFIDYLKTNPALGVMVFQMESNFNGNYYASNTSKVALNCKRPYYIWILGNKENLTQIKNHKAIANLTSKGLKNAMVFYKTDKTQRVEYAILGGNVDNTNLNYQILHDAEPEDEATGNFKFSVNVDLKNTLFTDDYLLNPANYQKPSNYQLKIRKTVRNPKYSHTFQFSTSQLSEQDIEVRLINTIPIWISKSNTDIDTQIANADAEKLKTFGLKYLLIDGLNSSFNSNKNNVVATFKFKIEQ
jgi:hypothetical protein